MKWPSPSIIDALQNLGRIFAATLSRSTFDSVIDDFIEDDWEKKSAFGVSLTVVLILTIFLTLLGVALSVSLGHDRLFAKQTIIFLFVYSVLLSSHFDPSYVSMDL